MCYSFHDEATAIVAAFLALVIFLKTKAGEYTTSNAIKQIKRYPGDYRVLAVPSDILVERPDLYEGLRTACKGHGIGLLGINNDSGFWLVQPYFVNEHALASLGNEGYLSDYAAGDKILTVLETP